jgi:uncharacterized protein (TIGR02231 family)
MNHRIARTALAAVALASAVATAAAAAEIDAVSRLTRVTVYAEGAALVRRGQVALPAGTSDIVIRGLPEEIEPATLRFSVGASTVRLAGVELKQVVDKDYVDTRERELRRKLDALAARRRGVSDDVATAETQLRVLESLASPPAGGSTRALPDGATLTALVSSVGTSASAARAKIRDANQKLRDLDAEKTALETELAKVKAGRKSSHELRATVETDAAVTAPVQVEYLVGDASWRWLYEARLDTRTRRMSLVRQAAVAQSTGEDWSAVELTLTTARPSESTGTADVESLFATLREPAPKVASAMMVRRGAPASPAALDEVVVTGMKRTATQYAVEYTVPGRVSVAADGEPRIYPVASDEFDVDLLARAVPSQERAAFLEARFTFGQDVPFDAADVQLYRDGALVGKASTPTFQPGAPVRLGFGIDDRIRVEVLRDREASGERGVIGRKNVEQHRERFQVTSFHPAVIPLEIVDRWPVARDSSIDVKVDRDATPPTARDLDGRTGVIAWRLQLEPRKAVTVKHYYTVEYPKDREVEYASGGGED